MSTVQRVVLAAVMMAMVLPPAPLAAQPVTPPENCTEVTRVGRIFIGHDCGEFASVLISGRVVIRKPWSRTTRASRAARLRERRERGEISAPAPTATSDAPATVMLYGIDVSGGSNPTDLDCGDFATQAEAQELFDRQGWSPQNDPHGLDDGGEPGVPCESRP